MSLVVFQGTVLAPVLFIMYINDILGVVDCMIKLFADDSKMYKEINLQQDSLACKQTLIKDLHLGKNNPLNDYYIFNKEERTILDKVAIEKSLVVLFDSNMYFTEHIKACVGKTYQGIGLIRRSFTFIDENVFMTLYKSLIRPIVESCSPVWYTFY